MKIGIDARLWTESGVGRYTRNLVKQLALIDTKNTYTLFALQKDHASIAAALGKKDWNIVTADIRWHSIEEQLRFPAILYNQELDLVHFPYFSVPIFYNKPFVVTIHDLILHHFPTGEASTLPLPFYKIKLIAYHAAIKQAAQKAKKVITVSNTTKQEIIDHLHVDAKKITVTYEGAELFDEKNGKKLHVPKYPYFLYVGNAYPHKNLPILLFAFQEFLKQNKEYKLVMVGKDDYFYKKLKKKIQTMGLIDAVILYGNTDDLQLSGLYRHATALVSPSKMEGFGLPLIEAMAYQCLVLASDIAVHKEICAEAALYFDPKEQQSLQDVLQRAANLRKDGKKMAVYKEKGFAQSKRFSWKMMAQQTLSAYETI